MYGMYWCTFGGSGSLTNPLKAQTCMAYKWPNLFTIIGNEHEFAKMLYACNTFMVFQGYKKIWWIILKCIWICIGHEIACRVCQESKWEGTLFKFGNPLNCNKTI